MDEDWDSTGPTTFSSNEANGVNNSGHSFSKGRGFVAKEQGFGGGFENNKRENSGWGDQNDNNDDGENDSEDPWNNGDNKWTGGEERGRGRGGYRGGRGGDRGGRGGDRGGRGGDRGGRGGDRGRRGGDRGGRDGGRFGDRNERDGDGGGRGRGGFGNDQEEGENGEVKKREIYIPPEISTDENEIFHSGNTSGINFTKYDSIEVKITGENIPPPIKTFESASLRQILLDNILKSDYTKPTPIQKHSLPIILSARDLMACAQTGSGKTAAFLIPIIHKLLDEPTELVIDGEHAEPQCVIISPTRELAIQICDEAHKFAYKSILKIVVAYGGTSVRYQLDKIMQGCHILVATPGRMNDFVKRGNITFNSTRFVVLDEADRMLDMGFISNVEEVMDHQSMVPTGQRQTLMFSATFPEEIQRLAGKFLHEYVFVAVGIVGGACTDVEQSFYQVDKFNKRSKLLEILRESGTERTLIFVETKRNADFLATFLSESNFPTTSIHGDRFQREREEALRDFKRGNRHILVATGVAARGLDIKNVKHVINFDLPKSIDEYVHRIGRTGRVGNRGKATSFFDDNQDRPIAPALARILKQAEQQVPDWLGSESGSSYTDNSFGGTDFRDGNFGNDKNNYAAEEPSEVW